MWARKTLMQSADLYDKKLWNFVVSLRSQSMYNFFLDQLIATDGFIRKKYKNIEDKNGQTYITLIVFDSKEQLEAYTNRDEIKSIYEYVKILSSQHEIEISISDEEIF